MIFLSFVDGSYPTYAYEMRQKASAILKEKDYKVKTIVDYQDDSFWFTSIIETGGIKSYTPKRKLSEDTIEQNRELIREFISMLVVYHNEKLLYNKQLKYD